jgi:hypothetical protein
MESNSINKGIMSSGDVKKRADGSPDTGDSREAASNAGPATFTPKKESGRVKFDERGNAIWEWAVSTGAFTREVSTERLKKLENPGLSLADDAPTPFDKVKPNPHGVVKGYNPYDSGKLGRSGPPSKKKDLRKLSDWLRLKKQAETQKPDDDE